MNKKEADEFIKNAKLVMDRIFDYGFHTFLHAPSKGDDHDDSSSLPDFSLNIEELIDFGWTELSIDNKHFKCFTIENEKLSEEAAKRFKYINSRVNYDYREYDGHKDCFLDTHKKMIFAGYGDNPFYRENPKVADIYVMGSHLEEILDYYVKQRSSKIDFIFRSCDCGDEDPTKTYETLEFIEKSIRLKDYAMEIAQKLYITTGSFKISYSLASNAPIPMYESEHRSNELPIKGLRFDNADLLEYLCDKRHIFTILKRWGDDIFIRRQLHDLVLDGLSNIKNLLRDERTILETRRSLYGTLKDKSAYHLKIKYNQTTACLLESGDNIKRLIINQSFYADQTLKATYPTIRFDNLSFKNILQITDSEDNILYKK